MVSQDVSGISRPTNLFRDVLSHWLQNITPWLILLGIISYLLAAPLLRLLCLYASSWRLVHVHLFMSVSDCALAVRTSMLIGLLLSAYTYAAYFTVASGTWIFTACIINFLVCKFHRALIPSPIRIEHSLTSTPYQSLACSFLPFYHIYHILTRTIASCIFFCIHHRPFLPLKHGQHFEWIKTTCMGSLPFLNLDDNRSTSFVVWF